MLCCDSCFTDECLKRHIREKGKKEYCHFCKTQREHCIEPYGLQDLFRPVINLYAPVEGLEPIEGEEIGYKEEEYFDDFLWKMLQKDWKVFSSNDSKVNEKIIRAVFPNTDKDYYPSDCLDSHVYNWVDFPTKTSSNKIRHRNWWKLLSKEIKHENRYFPKTPEWFLDEPEKLFTFCVKKIQEGSDFYRARISKERRIYHVMRWGNRR